MNKTTTMSIIDCNAMTVGSPAMPTNDSSDKSWRRPRKLSDGKDLAPLYTEIGEKSNPGRGTVRALDDRYYGKQRSGKYSHDDRGYKTVRIIDKSSIHPNGSRSVPESTSSSTQVDYVARLLPALSNQKKLPVIKTTVQNLNLECVRPQRAGVIIYTFFEGATFFGLGLDSRTHDLTDFGGGVFYKTDQNVVRGALREFEEETLQIFQEIKPEDIKKCPVIYDDDNLIIFIHLKVDPDAVCSRFNRSYLETIDNNKLHRARGEASRRKFIDPEVCGITWLSWEEFQRSIKDKGIMFSRVQRFLMRAEDFSYLL